MPKIHFAIPLLQSACGRDGRRSPVARNVDCKACQKSAAFIEAAAKQEAERRAAFLAQEPRTFAEPWGHRVAMVCRECGSDQFRLGDRTCYGHYDNFHCANCGHVESRLTETGMCF